MIGEGQSFKPAPLMMSVDKDLYLRRLVPNDAKWNAAAIRDNVDYIGRTQPWAYTSNEYTERESLERSVALAERGQSAPYGIFLRRRLVGNVVLHSFHGNYAELGYWRIDSPEVRGQGIVTRSAREVVNMGLGHMGLAAVGIEMRPDNTSSRHVAERLGATFLGRTERGNLSYVVTEQSTA